MAQSPNWNKVDVSYIDADISADVGDVSFDGFGFNGSYSIAENWALFGDYQSISEDASGASQDLDMISVGVIKSKSIASNTDIFSTVSAERLEASGYDETGFGLGIGIRSMVTPSFEVTAKADYVNIDSDNIARLKGEAFYYFTDNVSVGVGYEYFRPSDADLDIDILKASFRYAF